MLHLNEVSWDADPNLALAVQLFTDPESVYCADPFDIVAEIEEELGEPLAKS